MSFLLGNSVVISVAFRDAVTRAYIDPDIVVLRLRKRGEPLNTEQLFTYPADITKIDVGRYKKSVTAASAGTWRYRWEGVGPADASEEGEFVVSPSGMATV